MTTMLRFIITLTTLAFLELVVERKYEIKRRLIKRTNLVAFMIGSTITNIIINLLLYSFAPSLYNNTVVNGTLMAILLYCVINLNDNSYKQS